MKHTVNKESGLVSILTVIMFMIFISILVVGFIKIMTDEQRQTTDNDLSASALAAAQSGVEDAKRIILFCQTGNATFGSKTSGRCKQFLESKKNPQPCDVLKGSTRGLFNAMDIDYDMGTNEARVGDPSFEQYYTCLNVESAPMNVEKTLTEGTSEIIPLNVSGAFDRISINWKSDTSPFGGVNASLGSDFTPQGSWRDGSGNSRPPVIRAQLIPYTPPFDLNAVQQNSRAFFLVPANNLTEAEFSLAADGRGASGEPRPGSIPIKYTACSPGPSGYNCNIEITGFAAAPTKYYLRLSMLYGSSTKVLVSPFNGPVKTPVAFDNVQYIIDVTGRTSDVYRRIQSRVSPASSAVFPEYAIDTGGLLCKDIVVSNVANTTYNCP